MSIRIGTVAGLACLLFATSGFAQTPPAPARPGPAPAQEIAPFADPAAIPLSSTPATGPEQWTFQYGGRLARNVTAATLTPVLPDPAKATGAAVIVAPGGGFFMLSMDTEGYQVARYLADHGIAAFVLKYRVSNNAGPGADAARAAVASGAAAPAPRPTTPQSTGPGMDTPAADLDDGRAALRLVRERASSFGIDPKRVGFVGFSAGAMIALDLAIKTPADIRPDFIGSIYGPLTARDVPADAPPMFNALATDDPVMANDDLGLIIAYRRAKRPVEFHFYQNGGHGFGMRKRGLTTDLWIDEFYAWMKARGLLNPS